MTDDVFTREEALTEAYKRGLLPDDMAVAYEQASERNLFQDNDLNALRYPPTEMETDVKEIDFRSGAPVSRAAASFAESEAVEADHFTQKLSEYYGEGVAVTKGRFGLEFVSPETGKRTLIDESGLSLHDLEDAVAGSITVTGAVAGTIAGFVVRLPNVGAGTGAMIGDAIRRGIGHLLDVREAPAGEEALGAVGVGATEAIFSKTFEYGARAIQGVRNYFKPQVISSETAERLSIAAAHDQAIAEEISRRTGQDFQPFTGQLSDDPVLLGHQSSLKNDPETAAIFREQEVRNETVLESFYDDLNPAPDAPNTAVGRAVQLEARDQTRPRLDQQRDITDQAVQDLETITRELPAGGNSNIVNEATAAAAAARKIIKDEEDLLWNAYKDSIGFNPDTQLSNIKIPVEGEIKTLMRQFKAAGKEAIDPDDAAGLFRLQPAAFDGTHVDLWQLQRYLGSLKRRQRLAGRNEVATDPHGRDVGELIRTVQKQRDTFLKANHKEIGEQVISAEARTTERATLFDKGLVSQLLRKEKGEWLITDSQLIGGVIASGDRQAMEHVVAALSKHPAGVPTLQRSFLKVYRNEVVENGVPNGALHRKFMETHKDAIDVLFPGDKRLLRLGNFEAAVTKRIERFKNFEKAVNKSFRGKIQDISPEHVVTKFFTEKFSVKEVGHLMRLADAAGVGDLYSAAIRGQIRSRFYSPTTGISLNSLDTFMTANNEKLVTALGGRYVKDMQLLLSGLKTIRTSASGIATTRRPGLLSTISEGLARATVARPLSPHGVALTRLIRFHERAINRAWADIVENPNTLRAIIANKNTDITTQTGARILGLVAGGYFIDNTPSVNNVLDIAEEKNK